MLKRVLPFLFVVAGFVGILWLFDLPPAQTHEIIREGGPIENATATILWIGGLLCLARWRRRPEQKIFWLESAVLFFAMAVRESDPHRLFSGFDFMRADFYTNADIPLALRLFFGISFVALFGVITHWALNAFLLFKEAVKKKAAWTFTALAFLVAEIIGCLHHKASGALLRLFVPITKWDLGFYVTVMEEPLELTAAILLVWAALQIPSPEK